MRLLTETTTSGITRFLEWTPAYDKRPRHGIGCTKLHFGAQRGRLTVVWTFFTDWHLPNTREYLNNHHLGRGPLPDGLGSIGYHSPAPMYEDQHQTSETCKYTGGECYFDDSCTASNDLLDRAVADPAVIWPKLEEWLEREEHRVQESEANQFAAQVGNDA